MTAMRAPPFKLGLLITLCCSLSCGSSAMAQLMKFMKEKNTKNAQTKADFNEIDAPKRRCTPGTVQHFFHLRFFDAQSERKTVNEVKIGVSNFCLYIASHRVFLLLIDGKINKSFGNQEGKKWCDWEWSVCKSGRSTLFNGFSFYKHEPRFLCYTQLCSRAIFY